MSILGAEAIRAALHDGAIICDPAPARIEGAHIDVRLGTHYWLWAVHKEPWMPLSLDDAVPERCFEGRYADDGFLYIPARGFILAHTTEHIGTAPGSGLLPILHTRSTLARWGLGVHPSAGWGDEGYCSRWTLEIVNPHPVAVALPVGARVGCIAFHRLEGAAEPYQPGTRYNATPQEWTPAAMLPRRGNW
jgi:deoxycytidine triphosphate deaminase